MHKIAPPFWHCSLPTGEGYGGATSGRDGGGVVSLLHIK